MLHHKTRPQRFQGCPGSEVMLQAYLCLARAKYGMGVHSVNSTRFDAHLEASTLVSVSKDPPSFSVLPAGKGVLRRAADSETKQKLSDSVPDHCSQDTGELCSLVCTAVSSTCVHTN